MNWQGEQIYSFPQGASERPPSLNSIVYMAQYFMLAHIAMKVWILETSTAEWS